MSYTALYSDLLPLDREKARKGAKITDPDALEAWAKRSDAENILDDAEIVERTDYNAYPRENWDYLLGFRTWNPNEPTDEHDKSTLGAYHNIERLGYWYGGEFSEFWAGLSLATEPFEFYHPAPEHGLRESGRDVIEQSTATDKNGRHDVDLDSEGVDVAHVRCRDGEAKIDVVTLGVVDVEHDAEKATVAREQLSDYLEGDDAE